MSTVTVRIPTPLRTFTDGAVEVTAEGETVEEVLRSLGSRYEGLLQRVLTPGGQRRPFVNIFVGQDDVRSLDGLRTAVADGDVVSIVPAVAGGLE